MFPTEAVRQSDSLSPSVGPAIVHCSAGIGRSGTFVLVDTCLLEATVVGTEAVNVKVRLLYLAPVPASPCMSLSKPLLLIDLPSPGKTSGDADSEDGADPDL